MRIFASPVAGNVYRWKPVRRVAVSSALIPYRVSVTPKKPGLACSSADEEAWSVGLAGPVVAMTRMLPYFGPPPVPLT